MRKFRHTLTQYLSVQAQCPKHSKECTNISARNFSLQANISPAEWKLRHIPLLMFKIPTIPAKYGLQLKIKINLNGGRFYLPPALSVDDIRLSQHTKRIALWNIQKSERK